MRYLERALSIESVARTQIPILKANKQLARVLLERGRIAFILGNWELAMTQIRSAEQYASKLGDSELLCTIYSERCHQIRERLSLDEREKYCSQTLKLASKVGHPKFRIMPHYEYGAICWERGEEVQAQFTFKRPCNWPVHCRIPKEKILATMALVFWPCAKVTPQKPARTLNNLSFSEILDCLNA